MVPYLTTREESVGNFEGEEAAHYKVQGHYAAICAKTAQLIEMPFGLRT